MTKRILFLILILLLPNLLAQEIEVDYPNKAGVGEEFSFKIKLIDFDTGTYDVKIDILSGGTRIARILNEETWKSTYYYLPGIINKGEEKTFSLKIVETFETAEITIKIRDSSGNSKTFSGYELNAGESQLEETDNETPQEEKDSSTPISISINPQESGNSILETINLNPKDINSEDDTSKIIKSDYALYGLVAFSIFMALLFLLKKNKDKNEFE